MKQNKPVAGGKKATTAPKSTPKKSPQKKQTAVVKERAAMVNHQKAAILLFCLGAFFRLYSVY